MIAAATPNKAIEQAFNEKFASGLNDPVNPSISPEICGADTKFDAGTVKFSIYSEFAGDKSQVAARKINDGLPWVSFLCFASCCRSFRILSLFCIVLQELPIFHFYVRAGAEIGQKMRQYNWTAVRLIITLVGINRNSVYFNKNPAMTLANLNGTSVTQVFVIFQTFGKETSLVSFP